ncbi:MAG: tryptophan synthase subunit alpha [Bacteroidales bacterium]|nr:tryptophan synthase subunit alpha [Bacteroidales bacterium]
MNHLNILFAKKQSEILSVYFTAGYPGLEDTVEIITVLAESGVDMVEIGMPFSDPMADGPVIQQSNDKALKNGMNLRLLFRQLEDIRSQVSIPLIMMGYLNPVIQYGIGDFCKKCNELGLDGVILPDLPFEIYIEKYRAVFEKNELHKIFLVSPQTSEDRIRKIDAISNGFIYMVSSSSTTGAREKIVKEQEDYFLRLQQMNLKNPRLIGFGISNHETFQRACKYANGAIIGSAFIRALSEKGNLEENIRRFVKMIRGTSGMQP